MKKQAWKRRQERGPEEEGKERSIVGVRYTNTDSHPTEDIRTRRAEPNLEIFDEFAREITMKASRPAVREEPVGSRFPERASRTMSFKLRRAASHSNSSPEHANIDFRSITPR